MPISEAIQAAKTERARKDNYKAVLDKGGPEALYAELYRNTLGGLIDLPFEFEDKLLKRTERLISKARRHEIEAAVDEEWEDPEADAEYAERLARIQASRKAEGPPWPTQSEPQPSWPAPPKP